MSSTKQMFSTKAKAMEVFFLLNSFVTSLIGGVLLLDLDDIIHNKLDVGWIRRFIFSLQFANSKLTGGSEWV